VEKHSFYLKYNLQFFAKDGPGGEKTEPATAKKLEDARKEGNVAKSKDIVSAISLTVSFLILKLTVGNIGTGFMEIFQSVYSMISTIATAGSDEINTNTVMSLLKDTLIDGFTLVIPIFAVTFVVAFIGDLVQVKWKVTAKPLQPKFSKLNPLKGFKKIFSVQSLVNFAKSLALVIIILFVVFNSIKNKSGILFNLYNVSLIEALGIIGDAVFDLALKISMIYIIVGVADYIYQKTKFKNDMMMTKQEVKDEYKNAEGDPQVKGQIKQKMRQASMRRMMQDVPEADVVITNPTHFAVALKYESGKNVAPIVVAKGEDYLAQKIKDKARECSVEIVENKPLARALYANVEVGQEIPEELYQAVAEVLAYVYSLKQN
jgi:flagellar biosynthetic protein FlhB